jgi:folate-binding protein YgfZ
MSDGEAHPGREVWRLTGRDVLTFLQGVVSNDVAPLGRGPGMVWAALLTPQGKYLADFLLARPPGAPEGEVLLEIAEPLAAATLRRLQMYRLRADVAFSPAGLLPCRGTGPTPLDALPDPRHPALGWRAWRAAPGSVPTTDWAAIRVEHLIPDYPDDLVPDDSYILEMGFERLHGVDFRKGCYVGQEVTARMKHKTELKKGLVRLRLAAPVAPGTPVTLPDGREAGRIGTVSGLRALAHLRFDRLAGPLMAGDTQAFAETE